MRVAGAASFAAPRATPSARARAAAKRAAATAAARPPTRVVVVVARRDSERWGGATALAPPASSSSVATKNTTRTRTRTRAVVDDAADGFLREVARSTGGGNGGGGRRRRRRRRRREAVRAPPRRSRRAARRSPRVAVRPLPRRRRAAPRAAALRAEHRPQRQRERHRALRARARDAPPEPPRGEARGLVGTQADDGGGDADHRVQARSSITLVPIRPRSRGERRSLRTFSPGASLRPGSLAFNPDTPRRLSTPLLTPFNSTPISSLVRTITFSDLATSQCRSVTALVPARLALGVGRAGAENGDRAYLADLTDRFPSARGTMSGAQQAVQARSILHTGPHTTASAR